MGPLCLLTNVDRVLRFAFLSLLALGLFLALTFSPLTLLSVSLFHAPGAILFRGFPRGEIPSVEDDEIIPTVNSASRFSIGRTSYELRSNEDLRRSVRKIHEAER